MKTAALIFLLVTIVIAIVIMVVTCKDVKDRWG